MAAPMQGLPSWLETPPIAPLAPIQSFFEGFQTGQHAAAQNAARAQQADQFAQEMAARQQEAAMKYESLAQQLLHQRALEKQAILQNEALNQHRLAQEAQANRTAEALQDFRNAQIAHWDQMASPKPEIVPKVINIPGFGDVLYSPRTGAPHLTPKSKTPTLTPATRVNTLRGLIKDTKKELEGIDPTSPIEDRQRATILRPKLEQWQNELESLLKNPAASPSAIRLKDKKTGALFDYGGNESDVPKDEFEILHEQEEQSDEEE